MSKVTDSSKSKECYIVLNLGLKEVVSSVKHGLIYDEHTLDYVREVSLFGQYETLKEAKKARDKTGGVILKGIE